MQEAARETVVSLVIKEQVAKVQYTYKGKKSEHIDLGEIFGQ